MPIKDDNNNIFKKYPNPVFIETGSYLGDGINYAIKAGFQSIISIELSDKYYNISKNRHASVPYVKVIQGDSYDMLPKVIEGINTPITFWLDGHCSNGDTACGKFHTPLMYELEHIKNHSIKTHTIIIDDMNCWENPNPVHGFYKKDIIEKLYEINKDYKLITEEPNILVAIP